MDRRNQSSHRCLLRRVRTVLVGSGLDERSDQVVAAAAALARSVGGRVSLLHAAELEPRDSVAPEGWLDPTTYDDLAGEREKELRAQAARVGLVAPLLHSIHVGFGSPERALLQEASTLNADLVVVGATRGGRVWGRLLGSTTAALVRRAPCPVMVVRGNPKFPPTRIVAPVDLSMLSSDSFRCGMHIVEQIAGHEGSTIEALLVLRFLETDMAPQLRSFQIDRLARVELARFIEESRNGADVRVEGKLRVGEAGPEILQELTDSGADLVVIGTHGLGGFVPGSTGSVTQMVVRRSPCSVLVVPPIASLDTAIAAAVQEQTAPL